MPSSNPSSASQPPECYQLEHEAHYNHLIGAMPESVRRLLVAFIESTAAHVLKAKTDTRIGSQFPGFAEIKEALAANSNGTEKTRFIVVGFSFGATFPFCSLAFKYLRPIWPDFLKQGDPFICLFPPESFLSQTEQTSDDPGIPTLIDTEGKRAAHCGLRMAFQERFRPLVESVAWFPGHATGRIPEALTLPGTCVLAADGTLLDLHLPPPSGF